MFMFQESQRNKTVLLTKLFGALLETESSTLCLVGHYQPKSIAIPSTVHIHIHSFSEEMWEVLSTLHGNREEDEKGSSSEKY